MTHSYSRDLAGQTAVAEDTAMVLPDLAYRPPVPRAASHGIALIGAGAITAAHLAAYRNAGLDLRAIYDPVKERAEARRAEYFPQARVVGSLDEIWADDRITVVDIATHPEPRATLIETALTKGRHVLSQKPFVLDLDIGQRLVDLADAKGLQLAVNQNGRFAPHMAWMREACRFGLIGEIESVHSAVHWNHNWTAGTPFDAIPDLILYDFAIHWFDFLASIVGPSLRSVRATKAASHAQLARPPLFAQALIAFDGGQASLVFDGGLRFGPEDRSYIGGAAGSLSSKGPNLSEQTVTLATARGVVAPALEGTWFEQGFLGTMTALLCAIEDGQEPINSARSNLTSLALCFAAIRSTQTDLPVRIGDVRALGHA